MKKLSLLHFTIILLILATGLIVNIWLVHSLTLGIILGIFYLCFNGLVLGSLIFSNKDLSWRIGYGLFLLISAISCFGAIIYFIYKLDNLVISLIILLISATLLFLQQKYKINLFAPREADQELRPDKKTWALILIYLIFIAINFYFLLASQTTASIRSPWEVIPRQFFITYFLSTLALLAIILKNEKTKLSLVLISLHTFLSLAVALIVYKIGYGFDPFIHQATEKIIATTGVITPKPFYYLGQYSLITILAKIFQCSVEWIDKLLVPLLFAIYLPATIYHAFKNGLGWNKKYALLSGLFFLIIPFSYLITTTPYALAIFYLLVLIFFPLLNREENNLAFPLLFFLALTAFLIHPLAGVPAFIFVILLALQKSNLKSKKKLAVIFAIVASVSLPSMFLASALLNKEADAIINTQTIITNIQAIFHSFRFYGQNNFSAIYDFTYFYGFNFLALFFLVSAGGIFILRKKTASLAPYLITFAILIVNCLLLKIFISFPSLIYYEQNDYPQRILQISLYCLLPFFFATICHLAEKSFKKDLWIKIAALFLFASILTISLYLSYPRKDNYESSHGYSVSASDIKAVNYIKNDAKDKFVVLSDQAVAAAALEEFGFKPEYYYHTDQGQIFYYPIPTGGPLYQLYLEMVYIMPSRDAMIRAMNLVGVNHAYFVVNQYWWKSAWVIEQAKSAADRWTSFDQNNIYIFEYSKK